MKAKIRGFTLVELAIVMVIIGLLLGGILKGQELITNAKVKSLSNDFRSVAGAYYGYLDRYRAVAGDDKDVVAHVGGTLATVSTGAVGDGRIDGWWNSTTTTNESMLFWQHVRLGNLLTGSTTVVAGYGPVNAAGGLIGITGTNPDTAAGFAGTFYVCSNNIDGKSAKQLDNMLDDGNGSTGSMRAFAAGSSAASASVAAPVDATLYAVCVAY